ncbi:glutathione ABC transporter substrate-binding protein GsiB [Sutterella sp.]|uniref:glutathione ABC transporter substrate-binding protein GsiB n=1 Tax=Sutterella sp. TaxID=1981025 RepID=UPI0026E09966|nr:glutathione ABC transporter substrate-binding protein GsiB [Sutterella sp.]MDO5531477.1 glutathione ABC transporter substrate-binding protein GsiB [Sutterella sp.]
MRFSVTLLTAALGLTLAAAAAPAAARGITVAVGSSFTTLDPYQATDSLSRNAVKSFYEGLYAFDKDLKPQPQLATGYEVSADGLTYTFKLRQGVKFHDGTEFEAEAVKMNFDRVLNPDNHLSRYTLYRFIDRVEVVDRYTVRFTLKTPMSSFIQRLSNGTAAMICPSTLKKYDGRGIAFNPCGTGPYTMGEYNPSEKLVAVKNPNYRVKGLPKLDSITWLPVAENATRAAMVRTGEAAFIHPMPVEQVKDMQKDENVNIIIVPSIMMRYLSINSIHKPFDDVRVRQAINLAINREALCKVAYSGFAQPATGVIPPQIPGAASFGVPAYNPKKARELLAEAGYPNGFTTKLWSGYNNSTASKAIQFIAQQLAQVGIKTETRVLEAGQRVSLIESNKVPSESPNRLYYIGWSNSTVDPDWGLRPLFDSREMPPKLSNEGYYTNKKVDELLDKAIAEVDEKTRNNYYREAQKYIWEEVPAAFLVYEDNTAAASKHLKNFHPLADTGFEFYQAEWVD